MSMTVAELREKFTQYPELVEYVPLEFGFDDQGRLHHDSGYAMIFPGEKEDRATVYEWMEFESKAGKKWCRENPGYTNEQLDDWFKKDRSALVEYLESHEAEREAVTAIHGVTVKPHVIFAPETITVMEIEQEQNIEIQRILIERYGVSKYILDSGAQLIEKTPRGELYHKRIGDRTIPAVRVWNSTNNKDGSTDEYWLYPDSIERRTVDEAIASTFELTAEAYKPVAET